MRFSISWRLRHVSIAVTAWLVMSFAAAAQSEQSATEDTADTTAAEAADTLTADETTTTESESTIPDQPEVAPQQEANDSQPAEAGLLPEGAAGASALKVILGDSAGVVVRENPEEISQDPEAAAGDMPEAVKPGADEPLVPIPASEEAASTQVETASFNGVKPGESTLSDVQEAWGHSKRIAKRDGMLVHLYAVEPFEQVEVSLLNDEVASVVIRLDQAFPADLVAEQLELSHFRPVLVSNSLGEILGEAFPERGVLFAFAPGEDPTKPSMRVAQIILEPVSGESFLLRAETYLGSELEQSSSDLKHAIELDPENARAHWLQARVLTSLDDQEGALAASAEAVRLNPADPQYRVTRAQILGQAEKFSEAIRDVRQALETSDRRPHIKARALCLMGDLLDSGPTPDYQQAMDFHMQAIKAAEPLIEDKHPAIRLAAKEVLIDAHLGAAHNIGWGNWNQKELAVSRWLNRAAELVGELSERDSWQEEQRFRVAVRAMAAIVGAKGEVDPTIWTEETIRAADSLIADTDDTLQGQKILWELGTTLYDAVQVYQVRKEHEAALKCAEQAVECIEQVAEQRDNDTADNYLLGRLYFRLGAIYAINKSDHDSAIDWFEKASVSLDRSIALVGPTEIGRLGETLVSMGVSYWETDQRQKAVELTERGVDLIQQAVNNRNLDEEALEIPTGNLASMRKTLSEDEPAEPPVQNAAAEGEATLR